LGSPFVNVTYIVIALPCDVTLTVLYYMFVLPAHSPHSFPSVGNKSICEVNSTNADKSLRLVGGDTPSTGRLEIFHNNSWGVICRDGFGAAEGHVACRQIGYSVIFYYTNIT